MREDGIATSLHRDPSITTTVKIRAVARQQQLIRLDFEYNPSHEVLSAKLDDFLHALPEHDVVILSDYGKGGLTHVTAMIEAARAAGKPVLIDPKGDDYRRYRGATLLTPNRSELRQVTGRWANDAELEQKAQALRAELGLAALLVTRSEEGMSLFEANATIHEPTLAREVYDVSGAGDTVIATLAAMLGAGLPLPEAMRWSNRAAGIVVGKLGTAVATADELFEG
jgi:rfaE bifunctional protein kinase chain/domain